MSDMLSIGASGVRAYQTALGVVSDNIANAGSTGYSRRVAQMKEVVPAGAIGLAARTAMPGNGVIVGAIERSADAYKIGAVRIASTDLAKTDAAISWMTRTQSVLAQGSVPARMTSFFGAAQRLAADPTSTAARAAMLEAGATAAAAFQTTGAALDSAAAELDSTAAAGVRQLQTLGLALGKINDGLGRTAPGSTAAAVLSDDRDQLLEQMSALADVSVQIDVAGRATVRLGGTTGPVLVTGRESATVAYNRNEETGEIAFTVRRGTDQYGFTPMGGALAGLAEGAGRIAEARRGLNDVASDFAAAVNDTMVGGDDQDGQPGTAMFTVGVPATQMTLAFTNPRMIAAARSGAGPRDAGNLQTLQGVRNASRVEEAGTALIAGVAAAIESRTTVAAAQSAIRDAAITARDAVSGVDLDAEAVDLIRFQQAYQASSRVIQVARETIQTLLDIR